MAGATRRSKLWLGFILMMAACATWLATVWWAMRWFPAPPRDATPNEVIAAAEKLDKTADPAALMAGMMVGQGISAVFLLAGIVMTAMGLIDYAAEVRQRTA